MSFKRFFAFGCSFTQWPWPTWADIIAYDLDIEYENWGLPGLGNVGIASRMLECDIKNTITSDDLIMAVWSTWTREDRFYGDDRRTHSWNCKGDVLHWDDKNFIDQYWSMSNDIVKNSDAIITSNRIFKDSLKFNGHIEVPVLFEYDHPYFSFTDIEKNLAQYYEPYIPDSGIFKGRGREFTKYEYIRDSHPDVLSHLRYVQEMVYPTVGMEIKQSTLNVVNQIHDEILDYEKNVYVLERGPHYRADIVELVAKHNFPNFVGGRAYRGF